MLQSISLSGNVLSESTVDDLIESTPRLQKLSLAFCRIVSGSAQQQQQSAVPKSVAAVLMLNYANITDEIFERLLRQACWPSVDISNNANITRISISDDNVISSIYITGCAHLKTIRLSGCTLLRELTVEDCSA